MVDGGRAGRRRRAAEHAAGDRCRGIPQRPI